MPRLLLVLAPIALALTASGSATDVISVTPTAKVATEPVPSTGDAADDPAIWIHPDDPARSLVLGTDKKGLAIQDGRNEGPQNFKLFNWEDVAGNRLLVDTTSSAS